MVYTNYVLSVRTSLPVTSAKELIAFAKAQPQRLSYASTGMAARITSRPSCSSPWLESTCSTCLIKGRSALSALLSGEVQVMFSSSGGVLLM